MAIPSLPFCKHPPFLIGLFFVVIFLFFLNFDCSNSSNNCTLSHPILNRVSGCSSARLSFADKSDLTNIVAQYTPQPLPWDSISGLAKRDVCTDALPGSVSSMCTPSNTSTTTLCCKQFFTSGFTLCLRMIQVFVPIRSILLVPSCLTLAFVVYHGKWYCHGTQAESKPLTDTSRSVLETVTQTQPQFASAILMLSEARPQTMSIFAALNTRLAPRATTQKLPSDV